MKKMVFTYARNDLLNKKIEKDDQGWYKVNVGAINAFNEHGAFYLQDGVKEIIDGPNSRLAIKLARGYLIGECEHPKIPPGASNEEVFMIITDLNRDNQSHHIKKLEIVDTGVSPGKGFSGTVLQLVAWVKPAGPKGPFLQECLDDPEINTAFSIRCLTTGGYVNGVEVRKINSIITFDWVTEPGIRSANKFDTERVSTESFKTTSFNLPYEYTAESLELIQKNLKKKIGYSAESNTTTVLDELLTKAKNSNHSNIFKRW